ncbi:MAG TPA: bifunctional demethylmenaquinone methyltransferase/2-methoxy-6-polyprenyl-1,4-benzoquinol methylase UbiE [Bacteroidales bacterium]|nr:bifunctional demethylmenaquinone methyltransferase/2-methoxy-6-polyprenyl-1,4-benzoquinol methylase UbiE [Bacteroidales bacterium]
MEKTPEKIMPYGEGDRKRNQVKSMFDTIADKYDFLNHFMSFQQDKRWRRKAILSLKADAPKTLLDIATGTGDFALEAWKGLKPDLIVGADLSEGMMRVAEEKVKKAGIENHFRFEYQDCTALTFKDNTFDAVTIAFGVRNFENIAQGISEMFRVLKPGGKMVIIELSRPEKFPMKQFFNLYSMTILPLAGKLFSKDDMAYEYLPASIKVVPQSTEMVGIIKKQGFVNAAYQKFTFGVCTMYTGIKP